MLPRYRKPALRPIGRQAARKAPARRLAYAAVAIRAKGKCEIPGCVRLQDPLDSHHVFGRGSLAGIPTVYCDTPELILGVCRQCHDAIHLDGDYARSDRARRLAYVRFAEKHGLGLSIELEDPVDVMRDLVRQVAGITGM